MSGYVASARIIRGAPRLARPSDRVAVRGIEPSRATTPDVLILEADAAPATAVGSLGDRVRAIGERWSQLTFFLFDPNSWR
jgi:hypothetical protein